MCSVGDVDNDDVFLAAGGVYDVDDNNKLLLYNWGRWGEPYVMLTM